MAGPVETPGSVSQPVSLGLKSIDIHSWSSLGVSLYAGAIQRRETEWSRMHCGGVDTRRINNCL